MYQRTHSLWLGLQPLEMEPRWRWPPAKARPSKVYTVLILLFLAFLPNHCALARPYLIFSNKKDIRLVEVSPGKSVPKTTIVVKQLEDASALDFFLHKNKVCWTELSQPPVIQCSVIDPRLKGKVEKVVIVEHGLQYPEGLACDWINNKIYWTDSLTKRIEVTSLEPDLKSRRVLFWEDIDLPRAIVVSPNDGILFWSDWGRHAKIERASMDGDPSSRRIIVDEDIAWPNGLTLDYDRRVLYWLEAKHRYIASVDWEGNNRRIIFNEKESLPQGFALSVYNSELYWTDWSTNSLNLFNFSAPATALTEYLDGTSYQLPEVMKFRGKLAPMDIKVFEPMRQRAGSSGCQNNNGGCSHLCLASPNGYSCSCPTGVRLVDRYTCADGYHQMLLLAKSDELVHISLDTPDFIGAAIPFDSDADLMDEGFSSVAIDYDPVDNFVYWTDQIRGLYRSKLDGSHTKNVVFEDINQPDGIAVDYVARNLFWVDPGNDRIEVSKLDGSTRRILISRDLDEPRDIVLDTKRGWMFWSDWGERAKIERSWMDGTHRSVVVENDLGWPNGIAIDIDSEKIYFCDAKLDKIESVNYDGSERRIVVEDSIRHPFGLSILDDYIYWSDWELNSVERANRFTGDDHELLLRDQKDLMSLATVNTKPNPLWSNPCADNNGGCSHLCLFTPEGPVCECPNGYELDEPKGVNCVIPEAFLLYTRKNEIGRLSITIPNRNGNILPVKEISVAAALDYDNINQRIYWTDSKEKTISRAYLNGTYRETVVSSGLDFPDGLAVDWVTGNIFWTDTGSDRIEVSLADGSSRKVLIWKNLRHPASIAVDPYEGFMYWSSWSDVPLIEGANLDGSGRKVLVTDVGKTNGLTVDYEARRLYWTDIDKQSISYMELAKPDSHVKTIITADPSSSQLYALSLYKNSVYWTDLKKKTIERANKDTGSDKAVVQSDIDDVIDILLYHKKRKGGTNPCSLNNGGCPYLCLYSSGSVSCVCPSHSFPVAQGSRECKSAEKFLLFSQKNKFSRLFVDESRPDEVPDMVLPVEKARDIQSIGFDPVNRLIYWIDYGSKRRNRQQVQIPDDTIKEITIRRAFENGTWFDKIILGSDHEPFDLAVDYNARLLYWSCEQTNAINVTKIDVSDPNEAIVGSILGGKDEQPRHVSLHPQKSLIFWVNISPPMRIERAKVDGYDRKTIVNSSISEPTDLVVDTRDDLIFWSDIGVRRIECSGLDGQKRKVVIEVGIQGPVLIAIQDDFLFWGDRNQQTIFRVNKFNGRDKEVAKLRVPHLSALLAVEPKPSRANPCLRADCSHFCLVDEKTGLAECSCPSGSGLVLNADDRTCGMPPTCKPAEFTCTSGSPACIPLQWRCDGQAECSDHSDEIGCAECGPSQFKCRNNNCINATHVCDGVKNCDDSSDEMNCCPKEKFQCTNFGECIDASKVCDGTHDCSDSSDELVPHCTSNSEVGSFAVPPGSDTSGSGTVIAVIVVVFFLVIVAVGFGIFVYKRNHSSSDNDSNNPLSPSLDTGTLQRIPAAGAESKHQERLSGNGITANNNDTMDEADLVSGILSNISGPGVLGGSSNGLAYDRSHVTGASSSTTSSSNYPREFSNPPPSPATTVAHRNRLPPRQQQQHQSLHSLPRSRHHRSGRPSAGRHGTAGRSSHHLHNPPPTPYSTDFNDESDYGGISGPHFPSAANSVHGGYESSEAYIDHPAYNNPPPSTPQYFSDFNNDDLCPSPTPEENTFFLTQPPPSPVPSHSHLEEEDEE